MRAGLTCIVENFASQKEIVKNFTNVKKSLGHSVWSVFIVCSLEKWEAISKTYKQRIEEFTELKRILEQKTLQYINKKTGQQRSHLT
ncbi:MAG TPA: hypothetical protein VFF27_15220 [Bacteroidia bacterium]|nr:hypothetical protein [Bacteroidia bacterium]